MQTKLSLMSGRKNEILFGDCSSKQVKLPFLSVTFHIRMSIFIISLLIISINKSSTT